VLSLSLSNAHRSTGREEGYLAQLNFVPVDLPGKGEGAVGGPLSLPLSLLLSSCHCQQIPPYIHTHTQRERERGERRDRDVSERGGVGVRGEEKGRDRCVRWSREG